MSNQLPIAPRKVKPADPTIVPETLEEWARRVFGQDNPEIAIACNLFSSGKPAGSVVMMFSLCYMMSDEQQGPRWRESSLASWLIDGVIDNENNLQWVSRLRALAGDSISPCQTWWLDYPAGRVEE